MIQVGFKSDRGIKRDNNEDACFVIPEDKIYIVADGVGGNNSGEVASRNAVKHIATHVKENPLDDANDRDAIKDYFLECVKETNAEICKIAEMSEHYKGMATTLVLAYVHENSAYILNVGDSRAYLFRNGALVQLTEDHTYVNELVKKQYLTPETAKKHPERNVITRALGAAGVVEPDIFEVKVMKDDLLLLCTDGLHGELEEEEISEILSSGKHMSELCDDLITAANLKGGHDNITVVCVKI